MMMVSSRISVDVDDVDAYLKGILLDGLGEGACPVFVNYPWSGTHQRGRGVSRAASATAQRMCIMKILRG